MSVYINAVETYLPGPNVTNNELGEKIGFKPELIKKLFGNIGRHFTANINTGKPTSTSADLVSIVIKKLLSNHHISKDEIDFVIVSSATPDYLLPTSVNQACFLVGMKNVETYQILSGCSGAIQALKLARELVSAPENSLRRGIVIGVECAFKFLDFFSDDTRKKEMKEIVNYTLFGDGVGGCIISDTADGAGIELVDICFKYLGLDENVGQLANWRGIRNDIDYGPMLMEEYKLIESLVPKITKEMIEGLASSLNKKADWLMPPQLSGSMVKKILSDTDYEPNEIFSLVDEIGNTANAALFFQLKEFSDVSSPNETAIGVSVESSRWLSGGFILKNKKGIL
ncbi:3-oxoacyl-ACP synthase III family protein [Brenneria uluponensis]|uniref:3-oxoacyl-ACP synthase III family protein n=1 Tax=Brenneria uluponensis TaxID=3057057 RepID=UPI0028ECEFDF|nr:3-oxoacyl-ACP synthase [Brenneria ulupoensis]